MFFVGAKGFGGGLLVAFGFESDGSKAGDGFVGHGGVGKTIDDAAEGFLGGGNVVGEMGMDCGQ